MKDKIICFVMCFCVIFIITGCGKRNVKINDLDGVSMIIKEGTLTKTSARVVITDTSDRKNIYGVSFRIERLENGEWREVKKIHNDYAWTLVAYYVDVNGKLEFEQNWGYMYGELSAGEYRLVKDTSEQGEGTKHFFTVEFTIE